MPFHDVLILRAVRLSSPGGWDFLGALNPLEVGRKFLNDRHERRKDTDYRESAERERLQLENTARRDEIIARRLKMLKDLGVPEPELRLLAARLIYAPLADLATYQDKGVISDAEMLPPSKDGHEDAIS